MRGVSWRKVVLWFFLAGGFLSGGRADILELQNGQALTGTIQRLENGKLHFVAKLGSGTAELSYSPEQIESVHFDLKAAQQQLLESRNPADESALQMWWEQRLPYLEIRGSDTGAVGLALVRCLLEKKNKASARMALTLAEMLAQKEWNAARKADAASYRLQALIQSGQMDQAMAEVDRLTEVSPDNVHALLEARYLRGQIALSEWQNYPKEYPRWEQDKNRIAERRIFYDRALDEFLYAPVFYADQVAQAARSLVRAAELYAANGEIAKASACLGEIVSEFPERDYLTKAQDWLKQHPLKPNPEKP